MGLDLRDAQKLHEMNQNIKDMVVLLKAVVNNQQYTQNQLVALGKMILDNTNAVREKK